MKYILMSAVLAAIIGALWYLYAQKTAPMLETDAAEGGTNQESAEDATPAADEPDTHGSDAGMEFPTIEDEAALSINAETKVFNVSGTNHAFDVKEIRVKEGDTVTINFTSGSGFHDWVIDEFDARVARVRDGESSSVTFAADRKGSFEYYCSVGDHRAQGMVGRLIVE